MPARPPAAAEVINLRPPQVLPRVICAPETQTNIRYSTIRRTAGRPQAQRLAERRGAAARPGRAGGAARSGAGRAGERVRASTVRFDPRIAATLKRMAGAHD